MSTGVYFTFFELGLKPGFFCLSKMIHKMALWHGYTLTELEVLGH